MNLWQDIPQSDEFKNFLALLRAYHAGQSMDLKRLKMKILGLWQRCNQEEWTRLLIQEDPKLAAAINEFNATITEVIC